MANVIVPSRLARESRVQPPSYLLPDPYPVVPNTPREENPLLDYWRVLRKHCWLIFACVVVAAVLAILAAMRAVPLYQATSRIAIFPENNNALGFQNLQTTASDDWDYNVNLETQASVLRSDTLASKVIREMHLDKNPEFAGTPSSGTASDPNVKDLDSAAETRLVHAFAGSLDVQIVPRTRNIDVRFSNPDPKLAAQVANTIVKTFIEENFRTKYESVMQTSDWLSSQLTDLQVKVEQSQEKLVRYQKEHDIFGLDEKQNVVTSKLEEINRELTTAQSDRIRKQATYQLAKTGDPAVLVQPNFGALLPKLAEQESDLKVQSAKLALQYGPSYPRVVELTTQLREVRSEMAGEQQRILERIKAEYSAALQRESMLAAAFEEQKKEANQLNESSVQYNLLKRDAEVNRQLYEGLLQRLKEAGVAAGLRSGNIRVIDAAAIPGSPWKPNKRRNVMIGTFLGLFFGIGMAFVLEHLDRSVRSTDQVETLGLSVLAVVPFQGSEHAFPIRKLKFLGGGQEKSDDVAVGLVAVTRPKSQLAECYRALRTSILLSAAGGPPQIILVTSAFPQEGKTTTSVNSAVVLAQRGGRVLLVDADMRRPSIHRLFDIRSSPGLSNLLAGNADPDEVAVASSSLPNLFVLPSGAVPPHPAELLGSQRMLEMLEIWRHQYDHVVIDTPPSLTVTDGVLLSSMADGVILVTRAGVTNFTALRRVRDMLQQVNAHVVGVVLNAADAATTRNDGYSYYGDKYGGYYEADPSS
jgi:polysaccharide biosynthesis transport protein